MKIANCPCQNTCRNVSQKCAFLCDVYSYTLTHLCVSIRCMYVYIVERGFFMTKTPELFSSKRHYETTISVNQSETPIHAT